LDKSGRQIWGHDKSGYSEVLKKSERRNSKPVPGIRLPFREVIADVLKVKAPEKIEKGKSKLKAFG
jgi:hypothetical protein